MIRNISIGIDVGSHTTRVVVAESIKGEKNPKIIGTGEAETKGVRHGYVINIGEAAKSVRRAVHEAEKVSNIKIKKAFISVSGVTLRSEIISGTAVVSKADSEVTNLDVEKALEDSENNLTLGNRRIIQSFPIIYRIDGKEVLGRPEGILGNKLEVKNLFITCSNQHVEDLLSVMIEAGIEPIDVISSSIAASNIALSERQKVVGSALVNIGAETVSLCVFENGLPISLHTFSIGSSDITNDIALGLKIPLEVAESLKTGSIVGNYSQKKLDEIIEARLSDIFELIENHLKKIKRNGLLPAGIVFVGGGSSIKGLEELSKKILKLPSKVGHTDILGNTKTKLRDNAWFSVLGLIIENKNTGEYSTNSSMDLFKNIKDSIKSMLKQLMP